MEIAFTPAGWRDWRKLPKEIQQRLRGKVQAYSANPTQHAVKLTDSAIGEYRFRIGDYRVVFDISGSTLIVQAVGHRSNIYRS